MDENKTDLMKAIREELTRHQRNMGMIQTQWDQEMSRHSSALHLFASLATCSIPVEMETPARFTTPTKTKSSTSATPGSEYMRMLDPTPKPDGSIVQTPEEREKYVRHMSNMVAKRTSYVCFEDGKCHCQICDPTHPDNLIAKKNGVEISHDQFRKELLGRAPLRTQGEVEDFMKKSPE